MAKLIAIYVPDNRDIHTYYLPPDCKIAKLDLPDDLWPAKIYKFTYELAGLLLQSITTLPAPPPQLGTDDPAPAHLREDLRTV